MSNLSRYGQRWTPDEDQQLSACTDEGRLAALAERLGRSPSGIRSRLALLASRAALERRLGRCWTEAEDQQLLTDASDVDLAQRLRRTKRAVQIRRRRLLRRQRERAA